MDMSIEKYAHLGATYPDMTPFLVSPTRATCHQDCYDRFVIVLAERGDAVLYADSETHQFGIAFQSAARRDHVFAGRQYPSFELAVSMFLGDRAALDANAN